MLGRSNVDRVYPVQGRHLALAKAANLRICRPRVRFCGSCRHVTALGSTARYASAVEREPCPVRTARRCGEQGRADLLGGLVAGAGVERDVVVSSEGHRGVSEHLLDAFEVVAGSQRQRGRRSLIRCRRCPTSATGRRRSGSMASPRREPGTHLWQPDITSLSSSSTSRSRIGSWLRTWVVITWDACRCAVSTSLTPCSIRREMSVSSRRCCSGSRSATGAVAPCAAGSTGHRSAPGRRSNATPPRTRGLPVSRPGSAGRGPGTHGAPHQSAARRAATRQRRRAAWL